MVSKFVRSIRSLSPRVLAVALLALVLMAHGLAAHATDPVLPTITAADYVNSGTSFTSAIAPIIVGLLPVGATLMAIFFGPRIVKKIVRMFAS